MSISRGNGAARPFAYEEMAQPWRDMVRADYERVKALAEHIGYGFMMQAASELWRADLLQHGGPVGSELAVGPCVAGTVACECIVEREDDHCTWCGGCGWLTKRAKRAKDKVLRKKARKEWRKQQAQPA